MDYFFVREETLLVFSLIMALFSVFEDALNVIDKDVKLAFSFGTLVITRFASFFFWLNASQMWYYFNILFHFAVQDLLVTRYRLQVKF